VTGNNVFTELRVVAIVAAVLYLGVQMKGRFQDIDVAPVGASGLTGDCFSNGLLCQ
jgi:hypothetical protein